MHRRLSQHGLLRPCLAGVSSAFILNGMHHALATLGRPAAAEPVAELFAYQPVVHPECKQVGC